MPGPCSTPWLHGEETACPNCGQPPFVTPPFMKALIDSIPVKVMNPRMLPPELPAEGWPPEAGATEPKGKA